MRQTNLSDKRDVCLLQSVAEQLKVPLTIIARQAELLQLGIDTPAQTGAVMSEQARTALILVDNYLLGLQLLSAQEALALEPVSLSSTMVDVAHALEGFAAQYNVTIDVKIAGRYEPVMAHRQALRAALVSLGFSLVEALSTAQQSARHLSLAVHRAQGGLVAGLYGELELSTTEWRQAQSLQGAAHQPFQSLLGTGAAGMFVADALGQAMATNLRVGRYARRTGLAMTLMPSQQLQFV